MSSDSQLRKIVASIFINQFSNEYQTISNDVERIVDRLTDSMDEYKIDYELENIQHAIIDTIALNLRMDRGIKEWK